MVFWGKVRHLKRVLVLLYQFLVYCLQQYCLKASSLVHTAFLTMIATAS